MWEQVLNDFVTLWVVVDPIGTLPVFTAFTVHKLTPQSRTIALRAIGFSSGILLFFIIFGQIILEALNISLHAFQIAGGIVVFLFGLTMIFGSSKPEQEKELKPEKGHDVAVFPLAIPSIASPAAMMTVVLLTDNHRTNIGEQVITTVVLLVVLGLTLLLLLMAKPILRFIGDAGASIISRIMGLILASVAVDYVLSALKVYFQLG